MPRLIDADKFKAYMQEEYICYDHTLADIDAQPTVDAEPVVRCKDCRWREETECTRFSDIRPNDDDFCSRGERREDAKTD